jgi:hypothetical protein
MAHRQFDFYGVGVRVKSNEDEFLSAVEHDFSYFLGKADHPLLGLTLTNSKPDYDGLPELTCSFANPRSICFSDGRFTYIDYFGQGLNIYDKHTDHCEIITDDLELAREIAYSAILSRVSEELERKHLHRIHGLGIEFAGKGTIILLPNGGGKSTMALSLLRYDDRFRLISEDSPLLQSDGQLLPFPLHIGVHSHIVPPDIDSRFIRIDKGMEFSPKINIDIRFFGDQVSRQAVPAESLLLGTRITGRRATISPVSRTAALRHALTSSIIGIGLYQGLEFLSQKSLRESVEHMGLLFSRVYNNLVLLKQTRVYEFLIGRDIDRNSECLREFLLLQNKE